MVPRRRRTGSLARERVLALMVLAAFAIAVTSVLLQGSLRSEAWARGLAATTGASLVLPAVSVVTRPRG